MAYATIDTMWYNIGGKRLDIGYEKDSAAKISFGETENDANTDFDIFYNVNQKAGLGGKEKAQSERGFRRTRGKRKGNSTSI